MRLNLYITSEKEDSTIFQDLILRENSTNILTCYFYNEDDLPVDISGATLYLIVQDKVVLESGELPILQKEVTEFTNAGAGDAEIELTPDDTSNLSGNFIYQIKIVTSDEKEYLLAEGNVCFKKVFTIEED